MLEVTMATVVAAVMVQEVVVVVGEAVDQEEVPKEVV